MSRSKLMRKLQPMKAQDFRLKGNGMWVNWRVGKQGKRGVLAEEMTHAFLPSNFQFQAWCFHFPKRESVSLKGNTWGLGRSVQGCVWHTAKWDVRGGGRAHMWKKGPMLQFERVSKSHVGRGTYSPYGGANPKGDLIKWVGKWVSKVRKG